MDRTAPGIEIVKVLVSGGCVRVADPRAVWVDEYSPMLLDVRPARDPQRPRWCTGLQQQTRR